MLIQKRSIGKHIIVTEENISQKFGLKNIDKTKSYFIEEISQNELMSKQHKNVFGVLNFIEHLLILVPTVTGCVSILLLHLKLVFL